MKLLSKCPFCLRLVKADVVKVIANVIFFCQCPRCHRFYKDVRSSK